MDIHLIAVDLDGTLLENDHLTVSPRSSAALTAAEKKGVFVALASGRTRAALGPVAGQLPAARYAIASNGASILDLKTGETIWSCPIDAPLVEKLLSVLGCHSGVSVEVYADGLSWMAEKDRSELDRMAQAGGFWAMFRPQVHLVSSLADALQGRAVEKFTISGMGPGEKEEILRELCAQDLLAVSSSVPGYMELNAKGVNKGEGLAHLCETLNIPLAETMAIGDGDNDYELMEQAGVSVAMCSGLKEVKRRAAYETPLSNEEGGVGAAVEQFVLTPDLLPADEASLALSMADYERGCAERIHHLIKVTGYAALIARGEGFSPRLERVTCAAALVHDIGIRPALERYGSSAGPYQEKEGPAPARRLLSRLGYGADAIERIAFLVGHHHTLSAVDGPDFQALVEADALVNIGENGLGSEAVETARQRVFRTQTGLALLQDLYGRPGV